MQITEHRKHSWLGYVHRKDGFMKDILQSKMIRKPATGRKRLTKLRNLDDRK